LEFGIKSGYAKLIEYAVKSSYEPSDGYIYATVKSPNDLVSLSNEPIKVIEQKGDQYLIGIPRWGQFTKSVPVLAEKGVVFEDISGNSRIVLSAIGSNVPTALNNSTLLFASPLVSDAQWQRLYVYAPVSKLSE
jgi:hypothetical protein